MMTTIKQKISTSFGWPHNLMEQFFSLNHTTKIKLNLFPQKELDRYFLKTYMLVLDIVYFQNR